MKLPTMLRLPLAAVTAATVAVLALLGLVVVLAVMAWSVHQNTLRLLQDQAGSAVALLARSIDPAASPVTLSKRLDQLAVENAGVGFILDAANRLIAHPHIASGIVASGGAAAEHDDIIAAYLDPKATWPDLTRDQIEGRLVSLRGDDYGIFTTALPDAGRWRVGFYLVRPSTLVLLSPILNVILASAAALVVIAVLTWWLVRRSLAPLARLAAAAGQVADGEIAILTPLPDSRLSELARTNAQFNRMLAAVAMVDGLNTGPLRRHLATHPELLKPHLGAVTVMVVGVAGLPDQEQGLSADQTVDHLRRHLTLVAGRVSAWQGAMLHASGDKLVAVWGALERRVDQAVLALSAAREMRDFALQGEDTGGHAGSLGVKVTIGIAGGEVVMGNLGPAGETQFGVIGAALTSAHALERLGRSLSLDDVVVILADQPTADTSNGDAQALGQYEIEAGVRTFVFRF